MTDWAITIPKKILWSTYQNELNAAERGAILNYKLPGPVMAEKGDRIFVVWNGLVRGWMAALDVVHWPSGFTCKTTGNYWDPGHYLQRTGKFHHTDGPEMKGFQGIRRYVV